MHHVLSILRQLEHRTQQQVPYALSAHRSWHCRLGTAASSEKQARIGAGIMLPVSTKEDGARSNPTQDHPPPACPRSLRPHGGQCIVDQSCSSVAATDSPGSSRRASSKLASGSRQGLRITGGQRRRGGGSCGGVAMGADLDILRLVGELLVAPEHLPLIIARHCGCRYEISRVSLGTLLSGQDFPRLAKVDVNF